MENNSLSLVGRKEYKYNKNIVVNIPLVRQIRGEDSDGNNEFWKEVNLFTTTPSDMISELDSNGIDFETVSEYTLFLWLFLSYQKEYEARLNEGIKYNDELFNTFNLYELKVKTVPNGESQRIILVDNDDVEIINESIYNDLALIITDITGRVRTPPKKFGNAFAKKQRIKQDYKNKEKLRKQNNNDKSDVISGIIIRLVCNANFPYTYDTIQDVTIHDLIYSLKQIEKDIQVTDLMQSRLVGNDLGKVPKNELSRFIL